MGLAEVEMALLGSMAVDICGFSGFGSAVGASNGCGTDLRSIDKHGLNVLVRWRD